MTTSTFPSLRPETDSSISFLLWKRDSARMVTGYPAMRASNVR